MFNPNLEIGQIINNDKLCDIFKCSPQGGMRKSNTTETLVIVANYVRGIYHDKWIGGVLHYTGMGLHGDQSIYEKQNYTLKNCATNGIDVHLFEVMNEGEYTYCGRVVLVDNPYTEVQPDEEGHKRNVWMFPVQPVPNNNVVKPTHYVFKDMADYRARGQNVDAEYAEYRKSLKTPGKSKQMVMPSKTVESEKEYAGIVKKYAWLTGKRVSHIRYGEGTVKKTACNNSGEITILIKFDKPFSGIDERNMGYQFCIEKKLIAII